MDRVYRHDIPAARKALEALRRELSQTGSKTDWTGLRVEPLLEHAKSLERLLRSRKYSRETTRLPRGVVMFHSDLVYLRENIKALRAILEVEKKPRGARPPKRPS